MPKNPGRPGGKGAVRHSKYDLDKFQSILEQIGGNPHDWSLKGEWKQFYKLYFDLERPRDNGVKTAQNMVVCLVDYIVCCVVYMK